MESGKMNVNERLESLYNDVVAISKEVKSILDEKKFEDNSISLNSLKRETDLINIRNEERNKIYDEAFKDALKFIEDTIDKESITGRYDIYEPYKESILRIEKKIKQKTIKDMGFDFNKDSASSRRKTYNPEKYCEERRKEVERRPKEVVRRDIRDIISDSDYIMELLKSIGW